MMYFTIAESYEVLSKLPNSFFYGGADAKELLRMQLESLYRDLQNDANDLESIIDDGCASDHDEYDYEVTCKQCTILRAFISLLR